jgi:hypothetical protein
VSLLLPSVFQELIQHPADVPLQPPPKKVKLDAPPTYTPSAAATGGAAATTPSQAEAAPGGDPQQQQQGKESSSGSAARAVKLPCVLKDDGTDDWEAERQAARAPLLQKWRGEEALKVRIAAAHMLCMVVLVPPVGR